ncbi:MAG: hypothetical protein NC833_04500 [Candidatus Omnitrophica bacterium]|nr:hypothetical protein [Candidatus Omnitrophota bacterium]
MEIVAKGYLHRLVNHGNILKYYEIENLVAKIRDNPKIFLIKVSGKKVAGGMIMKISGESLKKDKNEPN